MLKEISAFNYYFRWLGNPYFLREMKVVLEKA